ncbi:MAG TPA: FmdB family zinc ribbon protein [Bacillota bacterium]|nr:FmdB family zinc ribbon protein [Bacillota bacterium]
MPIYEFRCPGCGSVVSRLSRLDEDGSKLSCSVCGSEGLVKLFSVFASPRGAVTASSADFSAVSCQGCGEAGNCPRRL